MGERPPRQGAAGRVLAGQPSGGQARGDLYDKLTIERSLSTYKYEKEIGNLAVWRVSSAKPGNGRLLVSSCERRKGQCAVSLLWSENE